MIKITQLIGYEKNFLYKSPYNDMAYSKLAVNPTHCGLQLFQSDCLERAALKSKAKIS